MLAELLWDHTKPVDVLVADYTAHRYGPATRPMQELFALLDGFSTQVVRGFGMYADFSNDMPFPELGVQGITMEPIAGYRRRIGLCQRVLHEAIQRAGDAASIRQRLEKWRSLLRYLELELQAKYFSEILSSGSPFSPVATQLRKVHQQMAALLEEHSDSGLFLTEDPPLRLLQCAFLPCRGALNPFTRHCRPRPVSLRTSGVAWNSLHPPFRGQDNFH